MCSCKNNNAKGIKSNEKELNPTAKSLKVSNQQANVRKTREELIASLRKKISNATR